MEWQAVNPDELKSLQFAKRNGRGEDLTPTPLFEAVKKGPVRVNIPDGSTFDRLKWKLSRAIKNDGLNVEVKALADKSGATLSLTEAEPTKKK
jgi:hypothetical protein